MPNSNGVKPRWQLLYEAAVAENDPAKLMTLVGTIEEALVVRSQEISHSCDHADERNAMAQAAENLLAIKTGKLGWPSLDRKQLDGN
jgi:hypothetical protein